MKNKAIWQAYSDTGALDVACPNCKATPSMWCTRPDGRVRRTPCIERITTSGAVTASSTPRDFSEPIARESS